MLIADMTVLEVHTQTPDEEVQAILDNPIAIMQFEAVQAILEHERQYWFAHIDTLNKFKPAPLVC